MDRTSLLTFVRETAARDAIVYFEVVLPSRSDFDAVARAAAEHGMVAEIKADSLSVRLLRPMERLYERN